MATGGIPPEIEPMVYDIYDYHDNVYLRRQAKLVPGDFTKDEWVEKLLGNKTAAYEREGALYKQYRDSKLRSILTNEAYEAINGRIIEAIRQNQNPDETIRRVREDVFGLKPGERNKGITYKAERLVRTELSHAETLSEKEVLRQNKDIIGVRIRYYGGPCPGGICLGHLHNGVNFQSSGEEATADFYDKDGVDWPPYHPNCYCGVARYLYIDDLEELTGETKETVEKPVEVKEPEKIEEPVAVSEIESGPLSKEEFEYERRRSLQTEVGIPIKKMNAEDAKHWVGYEGQKELTIYRGIYKEGKEGEIRSGDFVTTSKEYAAVYGNEIKSLTVPVKDLRYVRGTIYGDIKNLENPPPELIYVKEKNTFHKQYKSRDYEKYLRDQKKK